MLQAQNLQPSVNNGRIAQHVSVCEILLQVDGFQYECSVNGFYFEAEVMVYRHSNGCLFNTTQCEFYSIPRLFTHSCVIIRPCEHQPPSS